MALQVTLGVDTNVPISNQPVTFLLTVVNPVGGTACNLTQIAPRITTTTGGPGAQNIGLPLQAIPGAPAFLGAGTTTIFTWKAALFLGQIPQAQSNTPAGAIPLTALVDIYTTDSTGTYTSPSITIYLFPNVGVNENSAITLPNAPGSMLFFNNADSGLASVLSGGFR